MLKEGELGVHPAGSLGVAFFVHCDAECFIGQRQDGITKPLKEAGFLKLDDNGKLSTIPLRNRIFANLLEADALGHLPELMLICCNPAQLAVLTGELTEYIESLVERNRLSSEEDIRREVPILLVLPNGILSEQTVATYDEQLHESMLMQRLSGVTKEMHAAMLDRVVRGVSLQAGGRRGNGADTTYVLEREGAVVFAGGGEFERERIEAILTAHDYPFTHAQGVPGTRIEFDKAMISIVLNVGGLIHTVEPDGELTDLRMGDLCKDSTKADFVREITHAVFQVGRAIGAYPANVLYKDIWPKHLATILAHAGHVTSSLKGFRDALDRGLKSVRLFSNEEWILTPLARYAAKVGLKEEEALFNSLKHRVQESMARAIRHHDQSAGGNLRMRKMRLAAQRTFDIELYEASADDMLLIGTMLDGSHLVRLELTIHLPDEQITRSKLDIVRSPFPVCHEVESIADSLVGLRIERGVLNEIAHRVGGHKGCSHVKELAVGLVYFAASSLIERRLGVAPSDAGYEKKTPEERFKLAKELLSDSCLAYSQTTAWGLDKQIGIRKVGDEHTNALPLGDLEPSFSALLKDRAERWGEKVYIRYREGNRDLSITWREFAGQVFQIARNLLEQGVRRGDRIGMISENRVEMYLCELAVMSIGAVTVPVFAGALPKQAAYVLDSARPRFVVVSNQEQLDKIDCSKHAWVEKYYCMDFDDGCRKWGALDFAELTAKGGVSTEVLQERLEAVESDDLCIIMFTSGTTGSPKGVLLSHRHLISQQKAMSLTWDVNENDVYMNYLPWHHSFGGLFERFMTLYNGCELCLDDSRGKDIDRLIANWKVFDPTLFFSVPRLHDLLIARCRQSRETADFILGGRLRFVLNAAAALPARVEAAYRDRGVYVLEAWGLTETSPCVTATTKDAPWRSGCVGFPLPGVGVRIDSEQQEILVKGPNVMLGYLDAEEDTAHVITEDGWLRTGDLGEFTKDGLRLLGRIDGTLKLTSGEKVHPMRVETVMVNESMYISQVVVVGGGKDFVGALIYPDFGRLGAWAAKRGIPAEEMLTDSRVKGLYATELQRVNPLIEIKYERIRRAVLADRGPSLENGELTPSGKLIRKAVLGHFKDKIEVLFAQQPPADIIELQEESRRKVASES